MSKGNSFLQKLEFIGTASRLNRIYESLIQQGEQIYLENDLEFKPRWFALIKAIETHENRSISEYASLLGISHVGIVRQVNELIKSGLVTRVGSPHDKRVTFLKLTKKCQKDLKKLNLIWKSMFASYQKISKSHGVDLLFLLDSLEGMFLNQQFKEETLSLMEKNQ